MVSALLHGVGAQAGASCEWCFQAMQCALYPSHDQDVRTHAGPLVLLELLRDTLSGTKQMVRAWM